MLLLVARAFAVMVHCPGATGEKVCSALCPFVNVTGPSAAGPVPKISYFETSRPCGSTPLASPPPRKSCAVVDDDADRSVGVRCRALSLACREEDDSKTHENQKQFPFLHLLFSFCEVSVHRMRHEYCQVNGETGLTLHFEWTGSSREMTLSRISQILGLDDRHKPTMCSDDEVCGGLKPAVQKGWFDENLYEERDGLDMCSCSCLHLCASFPLDGVESS